MSEKKGNKSINKILVALDGSKYTDKTAEMSITLSKDLDSELYIIHVMEENKLPLGLEEFNRAAGMLPIPTHERLEPESYFERVCSTFVGKAQNQAKESGVKKVELLCVTGNTADEILKAAELYDIGLIVIGNRGLGTFSKTGMGSVTTKVANHANCTVMIVK